ncbi:MAG: hypothetical protein HY884_06730 [Deltaproteobacteria bacterium]|nr:hypothetical protein [Deltaproteobacteria bacterium]
MIKKLTTAAAMFFLAAAALYAPDTASAVPAFARQTGLSCSTCHFQHIPSLNAFGRSFKAGGYTQVGGQSLIEGEHLSIPATLNASLVTKTRFQKRNGDNQDPNATSADTSLNKGEWQFPDEAALLIGGRGGEHVGFLLEHSMGVGAVSDSFTSFKMPFVLDAAGAKVNIIPFTTDSLGAAYGMELFNTGAVRHQRPLEHRTQTSAQQYIGTSGSATGIAFAAVHNYFFVNLTEYTRGRGSEATGPFLNYIRLAATPGLGGWDAGAGAQIWRGTSKSNDAGNAAYEHAEAFAVDAQAQGTAANMPLGVYFTYASAAKSKDSTNNGAKKTNIYNTSLIRAKKAWSIMAELGVIPGRLALAAAYRAGKDGDSNNDGKDRDNATTLAATYEIAQNVELQLDNSWHTGNAKPGPHQGNMLTTLLLEAAF